MYNFQKIRAHAPIGIAHRCFLINRQIHGYVNFNQCSDSYMVVVSFEIFGLTDGIYGFHIHENAYVSNSRDCGRHFNGVQLLNL
jgi:Cu/Zn superoxide dismutase